MKILGHKAPKPLPGTDVSKQKGSVKGQSFKSEDLDLNTVPDLSQLCHLRDVSTVSPSICHEVMGPDAMIFVF